MHSHLLLRLNWGVNLKLESKKIAFIGDSITEGYGTTDTKKVYHQIIKEMYNLEYAYNYGVSGTRIARQSLATRENTSWDLNFELRVEVMERNVDAVVIFGGTNDYGHGDARFGDFDSENPYTFCGGVNSLITKLKHEFPKSEIIFMTPIRRADGENPMQPDNKRLSDYAEAILAICKKRDVKTIDLHSINPLDPTDTNLLPDGLHPSDEGHKILAQVIGKELTKL